MPNLDDPPPPPPAPAPGIAEPIAERRAARGSTHPAPAPAQERAPEGEAPAPPREAVAPRAPAQCHGGCLLQAILDENWKLCAALIEADEDGQQCAPGHLDRRRHWNAMHFFASKGEVFLTELALDSCGPVSLAELPESPPSPCRASGGAPRLGVGGIVLRLGAFCVRFGLGPGAAAQRTSRSLLRCASLLRVCPAC